MPRNAEAVAEVALPGFHDMLPTGKNRFEPTSYHQMLVAVLSLWNLLDANINDAQRNGHGYTSAFGTPYGYIRPVQLLAYTRLVWRSPRPLTYCEVGVNGGHGTAAMLMANPTMVAHSFDLGAYGYSEGAYRLLSLYFGERFHLHRGDSARTVPEFAATNKSVSCDVLLVDGDHRYKGAYRDIMNMRELAGCNATLLLDDITQPVGRALEAAVREGAVGQVNRRLYAKSTPSNPCLRAARPGSQRRTCEKRWGWATAQYLSPGRCDAHAGVQRMEHGATR